jgi:hypothetical protein
MLTIKIIKPSGEQHLYEAEWVTYHSADKLGSSETVEFKKPLDPSSCLITDGKIYVMNENGNTVSDYHLRHWPAILSAHDLP